MISTEANPVRIFVKPKSNNNKKIKVNGSVICYKCKWCTYQSFNLNHAKNHMRKCMSYSNLIEENTELRLQNARREINEELAEK